MTPIRVLDGHKLITYDHTHGPYDYLLDFNFNCPCHSMWSRATFTVLVVMLIKIKRY